MSINNKRKAEFISQNDRQLHNIVQLDVSGTRYTVDINIFQQYQETFLAKMFALRNNLLQKKQLDGSFFIARDGKLFRYILNFYLNNEIVYPDSDSEKQMLDKEYKFFGIYDNFWNLKTYDKKFSAHCKLKENVTQHFFNFTKNFSEIFSIDRIIFYRYHIELLSHKNHYTIIIEKKNFKKYQLKNYKKDDIFVFENKSLMDNFPPIPINKIEIYADDEQCEFKAYTHFSNFTILKAQKTNCLEIEENNISHANNLWQSNNIKLKNIYVYEKESISKLFLFFIQDIPEDQHEKILQEWKTFHMKYHVYDYVEDIGQHNNIFLKEYEHEDKKWIENENSTFSTEFDTNYSVKYHLYKNICQLLLNYDIYIYSLEYKNYVKHLIHIEITPYFSLKLLLYDK